MSLARRLRASRAQAGLVLAELGNSAGVVHTTVRGIELGMQRPGIDTVERIASALGVSPCWLAFGPEGHIPLRQKRPQDREVSDDPVPAPGSLVFESRFRGCGSRMRETRIRLGLTLRALADKAEALAWKRPGAGRRAVSYQVIYNTEAGATAPRIDTLEAIALALDVPPCWLAYGDESAQVPGRGCASQVPGEDDVSDRSASPGGC